MFPRSLFALPLLVAIAASSAVSTEAQSAADQFSKAASLYANPSKQGLDSFRCDVKVNWADMIAHVTGKTLDDANPFVVALNNAPMSIEDDLKGIGHLTWDTSATPAALKGAIQSMQDGLHTMWDGFFQSWNQFMTGWMVTVTDDKTKVDRQPDGGFHIYATSGTDNVEESFDRNLLMKSLHVKTSQVELTMRPDFIDTPQGKLVSGMDSDYATPPTMPPTHLVMQIKYQAVTGYQIPSELHVAEGAQNDFTFTLTGCKVNPVAAN